MVTAKARPRAEARLVCFSHAGGGATAYALWGNFVSEAIEVCAVQIPGRENRLREPGITSMPELVPLIAEQLVPFLDRPFAFYGHSMGAIVAFETARALRRLGAPLPVTLIAGASRPPQIPWPHPPIHHLGEDEFLAEVNRRYGSVPSIIFDDPEFRALLTPGLRADFAIVETYRHEPEASFAFPIHVLGGAEDRTVAAEHLPLWREQTSGATAVRMVSGGHLFHQTQRPWLAAEAGRLLEDAWMPEASG